MKVEGNIQSILSNYRFYLNLSNKEKRLGESEIKRSYIDGFIKEDLESVQNQINELKSLEEQNKQQNFINSKLENQNLNLEEQNISTSNLDNDIEELEIENSSILCSDSSVVIENTNLEEGNSSISPTGFLNAVKNAQKVKEEEITENEVDGILDDLLSDLLSEKEDTSETSDSNDYVNHGVFIDELSFEDEMDNSDFEESISKTIDEIESEYESKDEDYVNHGIYIDEFVYEVYESSMQKDETSFETEDTFIEEYSDEMLLEEDSQEDEYAQEQAIQESEYTASVAEGKVQNQGEVKSNTEVIVVPTNIRDFIKANQGVDMSFVLQYYKKKEITKAINLGKIYVKGGRLYI